MDTNILDEHTAYTFTADRTLSGDTSCEESSGLWCHTLEEEIPALLRNISPPSSGLKSNQTCFQGNKRIEQ
jgi:hypothetical protein